MLVKKIIILIVFVLSLVFLITVYFVTSTPSYAPSFLNIQSNIPDQGGIPVDSVGQTTNTSDSLTGSEVFPTSTTQTGLVVPVSSSKPADTVVKPSTNNSVVVAPLTVTPPNNSPIRLKINFYCYSFAAEPDLNCTKTENDIRLTLVDVNKIWAQAGIEWIFNSFSYKTISAQQFDLTGSETAQDVLVKLGSINTAEVSTNNSSIWNVAIIRNFPPAAPAAGVYLPSVHTLYFSEIKKMKTGSTDTKNFVLAHELGHSLTLEHVDQATMPDNLMVPGAITVSIPSLNADQISRAKAQALKGHPADNDEMPRATSATTPSQARTRTR